MTPEERQLITGLFDRMRGFALTGKDGEAEALIKQQVGSLPDAPYMLVQSVLVQEHALQQADSRIKELEEQVRALEEAPQRAPAPGAGSFLGGLFGSRAAPEPDRQPDRGTACRPSAPARRLRPTAGARRVGCAAGRDAAAGSARRRSRRPPRKAAASCRAPWRPLPASRAACWPPTPSAAGWAAVTPTPVPPPPTPAPPQPRRSRRKPPAPTMTTPGASQASHTGETPPQGPRGRPRGRRRLVRRRRG